MPINLKKQQYNRSLYCQHFHPHQEHIDIYKTKQIETSNKCLARLKSLCANLKEKVRESVNDQNKTRKMISSSFHISNSTQMDIGVKISLLIMELYVKLTFEVNIYMEKRKLIFHLPSWRGQSSYVPLPNFTDRY